MSHSLSEAEFHAHNSDDMYNLAILAKTVMHGLYNFVGTSQHMVMHGLYNLSSTG